MAETLFDIFLRRQGPRHRTIVASRFAGASTSGWLVQSTVLGIQNWMLITLAILAAGIVVTWWFDR
jgi:hypothetical protein